MVDSNSDLTLAESTRRLGTVSVTPAGPMVAGSYGTWTLTYTTGLYGIDNGGRLRLLFRYAWDGGTWQTDDPAADNYVNAVSNREGVRLRLRWDPRGGRRPWLRALIVDVLDETLAQGDQVVLTLGDTSRGSRGHRVQTFVQSDFTWLVDIEAFESGTWVEVPGCPITPIVAAEPRRLLALVPSEAVAGQPLAVHVRCVDAYGNLAPDYQGSFNIRCEDCERRSFEASEWRFSIEPEHRGLRFSQGVCLVRPGVYRFHVRDEAGWECYSNPVRILPEAPALSHYWGDLHAQYNSALGTGSVDEAMQYARDVAAISFAGHQPNDFQFRQEGWDAARTALPRFHEPGVFIPFLGYEWSGNTPAGGDHNVHFSGDDGPLHRSSHWHIPDKSDEYMDRYPLSELYREFAGRRDVLLVPHVGGRRCDLTVCHNPELAPVIEICSCHGRFEWLLRDTLEKGYTVGVIGGSDDHTGRPGAAWATDHSFGTRGGLAAVYAAGLSRDEIFRALRARHCYATTGERIALRVTTAGGHMMGDCYDAAQAPVLRIEVAGTAPLESVEIVRNTATVYRYTPDCGNVDPNILELRWSGARVKGRGRHTDWSGEATVVGAKILAVEGIAFDNPRQGVTAWDETRVRWKSTTSGDYDAVRLTLDDGQNALVTVETPPAKLQFHVTWLLAGPLVRECGGVEQRFAARLCPPPPAARVADFRWQDPDPTAGRNAYWVRVTQADGEMAWSSPIYVGNL